MKKVHYRDVAPDPVGEEGAEGLTIRWLISDKDGAPNFYMRVLEVEPGGHSPYHQHSWEHEVFILEGQGVMMDGPKEVPIRKGDVIFVPGGQEHQLRNTSSDILEFICLIPKTG